MTERNIYRVNPTDETPTKVDMMDLHRGDIFMMYESDGTRVIDEDGVAMFECVGEPYLNNDGIKTVQYFDKGKEIT